MASDDDPILERYESSKGGDSSEGGGRDISFILRQAVAVVRTTILKLWFTLRNFSSSVLKGLLGGSSEENSDGSDHEDDYTPTSMADRNVSNPNVEVDEESKPPSNSWHKAVALSTFGWVFLLIFINSISDAVFGLAFLTVWFLLPLGIYYDAKRLRSQGYAPPSYWWLYVTFSFIWFICIPVGFAYLILRRRH
jgi:hypothetical protein